MVANIRVTCSIDKYWDTEKNKYDSIKRAGTLIDIVVMSDEIESEKLSPFGIVLFDSDNDDYDGTFQRIPMECIKMEEL